jgi:hypothetical protein
MDPVLSRALEAAAAVGSATPPAPVKPPPEPRKAAAVAPAAAPVESPEVAALRAQLAAAKAEIATLRPPPKPKKGPRVESDPNGRGNVVAYYWHARHPVCLWPSQVDDLIAGIDLSALPASHMLRRLGEAAASLPRRKEGAES